MAQIGWDFLALLGWLGAGTALNSIAALIPPVSREPAIAAKLSSLALSVGALALPFGFEAPPFFRTLFAQLLIVETWRVIEIVRTPFAIGRRERVLRVILLPYEFSFLKPTERRVPVRDLAASTLLLTIGALGLVFASRLAPATTPYALAGWPRWIAATVAGYVLMEGATWQWVSLLPPFGWQHRPYQRHPILSRTIAEFWGVRWSSVIHHWLRANVFEPLARRRAARAGVLASFAASGLLHAYIVWPSAGWIPAVWMFSFFLIHGLLTVVESHLGIRRWPSIAARAFVIVAFIATVPLFMEPILRAIGLR